MLTAFHPIEFWPIELSYGFAAIKIILTRKQATKNLIACITLPAIRLY